MVDSNNINILSDNGILVKNGFALFWGSPFSNWYKAKFEVDNVIYSTSEQYMMHQKALLFNDPETAKQIMKTSDPKKQKQLGREVKNYRDDLWNQIRYDVVLEGCFEKFYQNEEFADILLMTEDLEIVEASPYDKIWGIGLDASHPDAIDKTKWKGENLLGKVLMEVRTQLKDVKGL